MAYNYYLNHKFAYQLLCRFTIEFFRNLGDIENPLTSLGVKYRPLEIRATATAHVRVRFESETSYLFPLNMLVPFFAVCAVVSTDS